MRIIIRIISDQKTHLSEKGNLIKIIDLPEDLSVADIEPGAVLKSIGLVLHVCGRAAFGMSEDPV